MYGLHAHNLNVVQYDPSDKRMAAIAIPEGNYFWQGMCLGNDGNAVYCAPLTAKQILKICIPR